MTVNEFPIESQTSASDRQVLLGLRSFFSDKLQYAYAEIGSFLGGSIVPFARDPKCRKILSIDHREQQQPDERGAIFDYKGVTSAQMIGNIRALGIDTGKIETFDLPVDRYERPQNSGLFDLLFIDGEHTDRACFRDFLYGRRLLTKDSVVCFHDSTIIWRSLCLIKELLISEETSFSIYKAANSEMTLIFFGDYASHDVKSWIDVEPDLSAFFSRAEMAVFGQMIKNRVAVKKTDAGFSVSIRPPQLKRAF
jgi:hypothetical protein